MQERSHHSHYELTIISAMTRYNLMELEHKEGKRNLNTMMFRLKDLSAYSLAHADIMYQREGVELLALGMFFGMTDLPHLQKNQERLQHLSQEALSYSGRSENIEEQIAKRKREYLRY